MRATVAGTRLRAAAARADGHFGADAAATRAWLAYSQEAARTPETAGPGVPERANGTRS